MAQKRNRVRKTGGFKLSPSDPLDEDLKRLKPYKPKPKPKAKPKPKPKPKPPKRGDKKFKVEKPIYRGEPLGNGKRSVSI